MTSAGVGVAVTDKVDAVRDTATEQSSIANFVAPDALWVGLVARFIPGDICADRDCVRWPEAGRL